MTQFRKPLILTALALGTLLPACDEPANDPNAVQNLACWAGYFLGGDCTDPATLDRVEGVLSGGAVRAELTCTGIALGASGFATVKQFKASRLQDDSCLGKVDLFVSLPPTPGLSQSSATELTRRTDPRSGVCSVTSFSVAGVRFTSRVEGGRVHVEGPGCTTTPGTTCSMPIVGNCTGDIDQF